MILVTFHSVSSALLLDSVLKRDGVPSAVIPVPRELGSSCGYAVEVASDDAAALEALVKSEGLEWERLYGPPPGYRVLSRYGG